MSDGAGFEPIVGRYLAVDIEDATHRVHVEEAGQGVPLLCLHTAGADSRQCGLPGGEASGQRNRSCSAVRSQGCSCPWPGMSSP